MGRPDDGWPGIKDRQVPLLDAQTYISGLLNSQGTKVRLTFRDELQQVWVGSAQHTQKLAYGSIQKIEAQTIEGAEEYSILRLQLGAAGERERRGGVVGARRRRQFYWKRRVLTTSRLPLSPAASSNYWLYFVPSQSVSGIKLRIRGVASLLE